MVKRIAGLDLSLTATGIATAAGNLVTVKSQSSGYELTARRDRLDTIYVRIMTDLLPADVVVIEGPSLSQRPGGHIVDRYGLWWRIVGSLLGRGVDVIDLPPKTLKKFATGNGNAAKVDMALALQRRVGLSVSDDNQVDAAWLRYAGHEICADPLISLPAVQRDCLEKWKQEHRA